MTPDIIIGDEENLHVRLAKNDDEIEEAQRLRYNVFYEENKASRNGKIMRS